MKILMVIPYFVPAWGYGGPVSVCYLQSKTLVKMGHDVTVVTTDTLDEIRRIPQRTEIIDGIKVIRFRNINNKIAKNFSLYTPSGLAGWFKKHISEYDVVHCHDYFTYLNVVAFKEATKHNVPFFIQPHGSAVPKKERGKVKIKEWFNLRWGNQMMLGADGVIVLNDFEKEDILKYFGKSINVLTISNGVEIAQPKKVDIKLPVSDNATTILSMGRLHPIKGFDLLIKTFAQYHRLNKEAFLVCAGPDYGSLTELNNLVNELNITQNVLFPGMVTGDHKQAWLNRADVFALFSREEPFPMVVLEALQSRVPVLLSKNVGIASDIKKSGCGLVIDPENQKTSVEAFVKILSDRNEYIGHIETALESFDIKTICQKLEKTYAQKSK